VKFLYADSLDYVDPEYDFETDRHGPLRRAHLHDEFPHEHLDFAPYDGLLISRGIVGGAARRGKYSATQCLRFSREGARKFLRYSLRDFPNSIIMGDCGAFSYRNLAVPPYSVEDMLEFYQDGGFTHGCSLDHVIFDFDDRITKPTPDVRHRYDITIENAQAFLRASRKMVDFVPVGVIQGWSARSMASAAKKLSSMGYKYLAVGGMVPLKTRQISTALAAIREAIPSSVKLHALGFGKAEDMDVLRFFDVESFDTTSPLYRAFKDQVKNYFSLTKEGDLEYYTAVRIPQAIDNDILIRNARRGRLNSDRLLQMESDALNAVRTFGERNCSVVDAVDAVLTYGRYALWREAKSDEHNEKRLETLRRAYTRTLEDRPWERCTCRVCRETGVEALIFRSSNRNKRRGIHNLHVFYSSIRNREAL
jgi:hypothetical protein